MADNVVTLEQTTAKGVQTQRLVKFEQWNVLLDGVRVGYLSFKPGSTICFIARLDPRLKTHIQAEAEKQAETKVSGTTEPPDTSNLKPQEYDDDIDP